MPSSDTRKKPRLFRVALGIAIVLSAACTAAHRREPYVRELSAAGGLTVWVVDGAYVRNNIDIEFTNFGQHFVFKFIPLNELWLDVEAQPDERKFFVDHLVAERALMQRGVPYDSAVDAADRIEIVERKAAGDLAKVVGPAGPRDPSKTHITLLETTPSRVSEWLVDGRLVRSAFDIEFTEGGHDYVYDYVPKNEVWIDNDLTSAERPFVILHELHERNLMAKGWTYEAAHADADKSELYARHHPGEIQEAITHEARQ